MHEKIKKWVVFLLDELCHASLDLSKVATDLGKKFLELLGYRQFNKF